MNTEGAVGVMRRVANTRWADKRRVAYPAVMNTAPVTAAISVSVGYYSSLVYHNHVFIYLFIYPLNAYSPASLSSHRVDS